MTKWRINGYKYHYTYITRNTINGKYYKGRHSSNRLDDNYLGSGIDFLADLRKYGAAAFTREVVTVYATVEESLKGELEFITQEDIESPMCYNKTRGGLGPERFSEERRRKTAEQTSKWIREHGHPRKGKKCSEQQIQKMREAAARPDVKKHAREIKTGEKNPMYGVRGFEHPTAKPVRCIETGIIFGSAMLAAKEYNCNFQNISKVCKGERHTCAGVHWEFVDLM